MSGFTRRMQIRGLKGAGYRRTKFRLVKDPDGSERPVQVSRGGLILDPGGEPIGTRWPRSVAASA